MWTYACNVIATLKNQNANSSNATLYKENNAIINIIHYFEIY